MKVNQLIELLKQFPPDADIFVDADGGAFTDIDVEPVTESHEDNTVIAYILCRDRQFKFNFAKDVN